MVIVADMTTTAHNSDCSIANELTKSTRTSIGNQIGKQIGKRFGERIVSVPPWQWFYLIGCFCVRDAVGKPKSALIRGTHGSLESRPFRSRLFGSHARHDRECSKDNPRAKNTSIHGSRAL
jgi:hypothetical protein